MARFSSITQQILFYNLLNLFIIIIAFYAAVHHPHLLSLFVFTSTSFLTTLFVARKDYRDDEKLKGFVKLWCEMPLGLGSLLFYGSQSKEFQDNNMNLFTYYVNFAVLGNIIMMILLPSQQTKRGWFVKVSCVVLTFWLIQQMNKVGWKTVVYEDGHFIFIASSLPWVLCHAVYRIGLITLPSFDSGRYVLLELISLSCMMCFHGFLSNQVSNRPVEHYFGYADTLVVATTAVASKIFDYGTNDVALGLSLKKETQEKVDKWIIPLLMGVIAYSSYSIWMGV